MLFRSIVIGGGFAGVTAARETSLRGLNTLLLEARPRLGGRTLTLSLAGHDLDLGGTWIGWSQPHVWAEMMRYDLDIAESAGAGAVRGVWMENGRRIEDDYGCFAELFDSAASKFFEPAREAFPRPFDPMHVKHTNKLDSVTAAEAVAGTASRPMAAMVWIVRFMATPLPRCLPAARRR